MLSVGGEEEHSNRKRKYKSKMEKGTEKETDGDIEKSRGYSQEDKTKKTKRNKNTKPASMTA